MLVQFLRFNAVVFTLWYQSVGRLSCSFALSSSHEFFPLCPFLKIQKLFYESISNRSYRLCGHNLALTLAQQEPGTYIGTNFQSAFIPQHANILVFTGDITKKETIGIALQDVKKYFTQQRWCNSMQKSFGFLLYKR